MKTIYLIISTLIIAVAVVLTFNSCEDKFLEQNPIGPISDGVLANKNGVNSVLVGAYSMLDGLGGNNIRGFERAVSNWHFGSVGADDAHKGSTYDDQKELYYIQNHAVLPTNSFLPGKWNALYTGAQHANEVIRVLAKVKDGSISESEANEIKAEAIFLRSVYLFEAAKIWGNVPYVDESVTVANKNYFVSNNVPILPLIEKDLQWAIQYLNPVQKEIGRVNSWAAKALLGKVYMFDLKFAEAKEILTDVIENGVNPIGVKYDLVNFSDNFNPVKQNNAETVFAVQMSVRDGANGFNGNVGDALNFPQGGPGSCCGFFQPSFSLVNAYKTDSITGLPLIDTYNDFDIKNDQFVESTDTFTPYKGAIDPRLDWTVGRRGIPYLDFGVNPGSWVRNVVEGGSPYLAMKNVYWLANQESMSEMYDGWNANAATSNNYNMIRFADVLLLAAEAEVEVGSMDKAQEYVNRVRARAAIPEGFVHTYKDTAAPTGGFTNIPAANYFIKQYPVGFFASLDKKTVREYVRFERRIELALEGHRFFDLQRWDKAEPGYMAKVLNDYMDHEKKSVPNYQIFTSGNPRFIQGKNEYYPIPQMEIDNSVNNGVPTLKQNPGY